MHTHRTIILGLLITLIISSGCSRFISSPQPEQPKASKPYTRNLEETGQEAREEPVRIQLSPQGEQRVALVQQSLAERGYNPGAVDGIIGQNTREALRSLQYDHGLKVTGRIDAATLDFLGITEHGVSNPTMAKGGQAGLKQPIATGKVVKPTHLMRSAQMMAESLIEIPVGTSLEVVEEKGDYYKVGYRGQYGFVYGRNIELDEAP